MKTIVEILKLSSDFLEKQGISGARRDAEELLSSELGLSRMELYLQHDRPLTDKELEGCRKKIVRRGKGEPLAYILGFVDFFDCRIEVTPSVLIPRPETEILVDKIVNALSPIEKQNNVLLDLCCGSGCIGLALKKRFPELHVILSDISPDALTLAKRNSLNNGLDVEFLQGDLLTPLVGRSIDYVVCNPPYISEEEYQTLDPQVKNYEPKLALTDSGIGTTFYHRLNNELPVYLKPGGHVWLEIGYQQGPLMASIFPPSVWRVCEVSQDWAKKDRFCHLIKEGTS